MKTYGDFGLTSVGAAITVVVFVLFGVGSVALAVIDARTMRLPDRIVIPLYGIGAAGLGLAALLAHDAAALRHLAAALGSAAAAFVLFYLIAMFGPMGYGDVKLAGVIGLYLGWLGVAPVFTGLFLGTVSAALVALTVVAVRSARRMTWRRLELAYGPYLLFGAWTAVLLFLF
jgi:leader peptidase (prepilin peptidase)/N-methyltransferase